MKSPGLQLTDSREEKIGYHQERSGCCHQPLENPATQDPNLQSWLVLLRSEGRAPQSRDCRLKPHCIKKNPTAQKLRSRRKGSSQAVPCQRLPPHLPPGSPRWHRSCHHPPFLGAGREGDIIMQINPPGNPLCFQIPISSPATSSFECKRG